MPNGRLAMRTGVVRSSSPCGWWGPPLVPERYGRMTKGVSGQVNRRNLLRITALGTGAAVASGVLGQERALGDYGVVPALAGKKAIVIGSGFGGAVAAYRLGQAGLRVTVLERGKRWDDGTPLPQRHAGDGITVLRGVGVGGGSLVAWMSMTQPRLR